VPEEVEDLLYTTSLHRKSRSPPNTRPKTSLKPLISITASYYRHHNYCTIIFEHR